MPEEHARLSASGSAMWAYCSGSLMANENLPDEGSSYAAEGTAAHHMAHWCLTNAQPTEQAPTGDKLWAEYDSAEFRAEVQRHIDYVHSYVEVDYAAYESRVDFSPWVPGGFGTADVILGVGEELVVIDLKFGKGVPVGAMNNTQLLLYALGALNQFDFEREFRTVKLCVSQPRINNFSDWTIPVGEPFTFSQGTNGSDFDSLGNFAGWIKERAQLALQPDAPRTAGEKQCRWCRVAGSCRVRHDAVIEEARMAFEDRPPMASLTDAEIAELLPVVERAANWIKDLQGESLKRAKAGAALPGYKLVAGVSRSKWQPDAKAVAAALQGASIDPWRKELITITEAKKLLGKQAAELLPQLTVKPAGAPTLVPLSDKRPAMGSTQSAIADFSND